MATSSVSSRIDDLASIERALLLLGATVARALANLVGEGVGEHETDELTPEQIERIRLSLWQLQAAFNTLSHPIDRGKLHDALADVSFLAQRFRDEIIVWISFMDELVDKAERLYGSDPGRGQYKQQQVKAALLYVARREGLQLPLVPGVFQPIVFSYAADVLIAFVVSQVNINGLWDRDIPRRPARMTLRLTAPVASAATRGLDTGGRFLLGIAWRIIAWLNRLSPELRASVEAMRLDVRGTLNALGGIARFAAEHPDIVRALAQIFSIATQQAEAFVEMTGPQKQAYVRELILAFLDQLGIDLDGLWGTFVKAFIDVMIDATVSLFNRRGLFH
jgi:hypothetical protein